MPTLNQRLKATSLHLCISIAIGLCAAVLMFWLWYPQPYRDISGGRDLFLLIIGVDIAIGPLITLAIFNNTKPKRELFMDLSIVAVLQITALTYGLWTVFVARPVHLVFEYSRLTVVHAVDVDASLLRSAPPELRALPLTGPTAIALRPFKNAQEQLDATMAALGGAPLAARSDFWQSYEASVTDILKVARPAAELQERFLGEKAKIDSAIAATGLPAGALRYLPVVGRKDVWTALLDASTAKPVGFLQMDSF